VLGIPCSPANWPMGTGRSFVGLFDRWAQSLQVFHGAGGSHRGEMRQANWDDGELLKILGKSQLQRLRDEVSLLETAGTPFDREGFLAGRRRIRAGCSSGTRIRWRSGVNAPGKYDARRRSGRV